MKNLTQRLGGVLFVLTVTIFASAQRAKNVFEIVQRRDVKIDQIELLAKKYFDSVGTERGTGYKQYQRWLYEVRFHLDDQGFQRTEDYDGNTYEAYKAANKRTIKSSVNLGTASLADPWTEKGPYSWNRTAGWNPGVGRITAIAVHPLDTNLIYVATPGGGIWKTTNFGSTWQPLTDAVASWMTMYSVAVDPTNKNVVYAGNNAGTLIKSTDGGASWTSVGRYMSGTVSKILINPTNTSNIFAAAQNGIFRSTDAGINWTKVYSGSTEDIEFLPGNTNIMIGTGAFSPSVVRSTDNGVTWVGLTATEGITNSARSLVAVSAKDPNRVYVSQAYGNEFGRLYVSTDGGATFTTSITGSSAGCTNFFGYETTGCGVGGQAGYDMALTADPSDANVVYIGGIIVFKSTDGGKTFAAQTAWSYPNSIGYNHADVHVLEMVGRTVYSGSDGGIYYSRDNGDNWTDISRGLGIRQFYRIASSATNSQLFTGGAQDNGSSAYNGSSWIDWLGADGMDGMINPTNEKMMWGTSQYGQVYRTTNGGSSYTTLTKPSAGEWVTPLVYHTKTNVIYGGWTGVYKSVDNGDNWISVSGANIPSTITALAVAPSNENFIYASKSTNLFITTNGGTTWSTTSLPSTINAIAVSPSAPHKVWVVCNSTSNRVFASVDSGKTFTNISGNLPALVARSIAVDNDAEESIYVGMNVGVYYLNNTTTTWADISNNLPKVPINDIDIQKSGSILRVGTYGRGVWERSLLGTQQTQATCNAATNLRTVSTTSTTANLAWDAASGASSYKVEYKLSSASTWTVASDTCSSTSISISNLSSNSIYDWRVTTNCTATSSSYATAQFQTAIAITAPATVSPSNITYNKASISWSAVSGATQYEVDYRTVGSATWTTLRAATSSTSDSLTALSASTQYEVRVNASNSTCTSAFTAATFTTAAMPVITDIYETNNTSKQSKAIGINQQINALINNNTDEDWFKFSTTKASILSISLTQLPADFDLYLYDRNMRLIGSALQTGNNDDVVSYNNTIAKNSFFVRIVGKNRAFDANNYYKLLVAETAPAAASTSGTSNVAENSITDAVSLYPNPASTQFSVVFNSTSEGPATLEITNAGGAIQKKVSMQVLRGQNRIDSNVAELKAGVYMIRISGNNVNIQKQLLIVK